MSTKPADLMVNNGWFLELSLSPEISSSPATQAVLSALGLDNVLGGGKNYRFETLSGLQETMEHVETVDAGTNKKKKFVNQILDLGELSLARTEEGTAEDIELAGIVKACQKGLKLTGRLTKKHHGIPLRVIILEGFAFKSRTYPTFDVQGTDKFQMQYGAFADDHFDEN
ncbi:hypothetical protein [Flammeovirga agarivorans]|uniref:Uncharacterized protein n=1 Tax=Flammeovirga agarivorans TaxID=2726742 RepID=A0A7X8SR80_9BACT|nr:hypothetical protein [Flammeovirga agarivorans]NLR94866.1 hypothetical protein [Flammeovirga agarivorans]